MSKNNFNFQYVIGRGGFGKVSSQSAPCVILFISCAFVTGVESRVQEDDANLCHEGDVQGSYYLEKVSHLGHEREEATGETLASILGEHELCLLGQGEPLPSE